MIKDENVRVSSIIPKDVYKKLAKEADYEARSISNMIAKILKEHYKIKSDD